jgi:hypothetical protein
MPFDWHQVGTPPASDEIEVTVIGPGFGECIVVHVGLGRWLIVDSCRDPETKQPVALKYLQALGVNAGECVDWVVATHWHSDHVGGIGETLAACTSARFVCATVLQKREFLKYAAQSRVVSGPGTALDFLGAFEELMHRKATPVWTTGGRVLATRAATGGQPEFRLEALSPSDAEFSLFLSNIAGQVRVKGMPHRAYVSTDPNHAAIVLSLRWGSDAVLLGADLLSHSSPDRGWLAAAGQATILLAPKASLVKIPHHGSESAHAESMWSDLMEADPVAVVTPYSRGKKEGRPPKKSDLARIVKLSSEAYLTAPTESGRARKKTSPVAVGLAQSGITMRSLSANVGLVRMRRAAGGSWESALFGRAKALN